MDENWKHVFAKRMRRFESFMPPLAITFLFQLSSALHLGVSTVSIHLTHIQQLMNISGH
jgi:hypothetical protein